MSGSGGGGNNNNNRTIEVEVALTHFRAGVTGTLRTWGALRAAIDGEWGGIESHDKADDLRTNIYEHYDGTKAEPMSLEELEDNLIGYMEEEFSVVLEDGSERHIAHTIATMYEQCSANDLRTVAAIVEEASKLKRTAKPRVVLSEDSEMESDDDGDDIEIENDGDQNVDDAPAGDDMMDADVDERGPFQYSLEYARSYCEGRLFEGGRSRAPKQPQNPPRQLGEAPPPIPEAEVDEDGFTAVPTRKSKRGNKPK